MRSWFHSRDLVAFHPYLCEQSPSQAVTLLLAGWGRSGVIQGDGRIDCDLWPSGVVGAGDSQHEMTKRTEAPVKRRNDPQREGA